MDQRQSIREAYTSFITKFPEYAQTSSLDELRKKEFHRLDGNGHVYLDYVGANLYPDSLVREHMEWLTREVYGNPHSTNPTSVAATEACEAARAYVKEFFNDKDDEYAVIFTANASGALKLVGEAYDFCENSHLVLTADNHNSVNGIREFARIKNATFRYAPLNKDSLRIQEAPLMEMLRNTDCSGKKLFAFPAQSNFSGVKHELSLIETAQSLGWNVLLDAAAFVPTSPLDLSVHKPEFVTLSFYKMFGYPTGLGCLLAKKSILGELHRPWFSGGTIEVASVRGDGFYLADEEVGFEDGTINFLGIPAVKMGLRFMKEVGMDRIRTRTYSLTAWALDQMLSAKHDNGMPLIHLYGTDEMDKRGATITFNVVDDAGNTWFYEDVEHAANELKLSIRSGCFCNPGADETANEITQENLRPIFESGQKITYKQFVEMARGKFTVGAVRASFGYISNFEDAVALVNFVLNYRNQKAPTS